MKKIFQALAVILALAVFPGFAQAKISLKDVKEFAKAEVKIESLRKQKPVDWEAIEEQYAICEPIVKWTDETFGTSYAQEIPEALKKSKDGKKPRVNQQILAKGLQHVNVLNIMVDMDELGRVEIAPKRAAAFYQGIKPTFVRRDKDFFKKKPTLAKEAESALKKLVKGGPSGYIMARRALEDAIYRTYALSVLYEIQAVEKLRATKPAKCAVKVKEAEIFYRIIKPRLRKMSPNAARNAERILSASYGKMNAKALERNLAKGLRGRPLR